ncbi:PTS sugar transporter subunit IIB [Salmonella enterica subsp. enterica serovar Saintpaul]|nr:PTS sugar transporter subunit IIB [Salmonella enterica subsp. enterica serovar Saintpaul]
MLTLRVDDRLIHTQVVAGWIQALALTRIIVGNDDAAEDRMHALALEMALPPGVSCHICTPEDVADQILPGARQMVIVASLACASRVVSRIPAITEINLANCSQYHRQAECQQFAASVWLTNDELALLQDLKQHGISVVNYPSPPVNEK